MIVGGGETGIRTLETVPRLHTFQACAFDHSATCPLRVSYISHWPKRKRSEQKTMPYVKNYRPHTFNPPPITL